MDLRSLYIIVSTLAVSLGIVAGWNDARRSKGQPEAEELAAEAQENRDEVSAPPWQLPRAKQRRREKLWDAGGESETVGGWDRDDSPRQGSTAIPSVTRIEPSPGVTDTTGSQVGVSERLSTPVEESLGAIESLIGEGDFLSAGQRAVELAARFDGEARARAFRLHAKALAFRQLVPTQGGGEAASNSDQSTPTEPTVVTAGSKVVRLANGIAVIASKVVEEPDRYLITFATGETREIWREDVLALEEATGEVAQTITAPRDVGDVGAANDWSRIASRIEAIDHPVDLYIQGVKKAYDLGLPREGLRLLNKLIGMRDSDSIPLLFARGDGQEAYICWQVATGQLRVVGRDLRSFIDEEAARLDRGQSTTDRGDAPTKLAAGEAESLAQAKQLLADGSSQYRRALAQEEANGEIRQAQAKLLRAQAILSRLPLSTEVRELSRALGQMLQDVGKAMPFFE